jgi:hypothetical protein
MDSVIIDFLSIFVFTLAVGYFIQKYLKKQHLAAAAKTSGPSSSLDLETEVDDSGDHTNVTSVLDASIAGKKSAEDAIAKAASCDCGTATSCCKTSKVSDAGSEFHQVKIYYGSQTGTAQVITC